MIRDFIIYFNYAMIGISSFILGFVYNKYASLSRRNAQILTPIMKMTILIPAHIISPVPYCKVFLPIEESITFVPIFSLVSLYSYSAYAKALNPITAIIIRDSTDCRSSYKSN